MKADNEAEKAFQEWYEGLQTLDEMFNLLETAEGPGIKAQGPEQAEQDD